MHYEKIVLSFISMLQFCKGAVQKDLFLTPKETLRSHGRMVYYKPQSIERNGTLPWEETLKHITFISLFGEAINSTNLNDLREYKELMSANYERGHEEYSRFGDIITMARGWVEKANGYNFKEGTCEVICSNTAIAMWRVQKIRHRDLERGFRYEMKFSVYPLNYKSQLKNAHNSKQYNKSFILKDNEYPKSFNTLTQRSDNFEIFSNERQARIVNFDANQNVPHMSSLNIGEFLKEVPKASSKIGHISSSQNHLPTTYRPNYRVPDEGPKTIITHHFHHHYFMNDDETPKNRDQKDFHGNVDAIRIVEPPIVKLVSPRYVFNTSTTTTEAPVGVFYMQQIPLYIQSFPREETSTQPFKESEQLKETRYSEPDPLYENIDRINASKYKHSTKSSFANIQHQVERPYSAQNSIIEQLPQSAEDQETHISYVGIKQENTTIEPSLLTSPFDQRTTPQKTLVSLESSIPIASQLSPNIRNYIRSTTEQPILKWKPKRQPKDKQVNRSGSTIQDNSGEKLKPVTPNYTDFEVITQKSVSKSISVKVGNHSQVIAFVTEIATSVSSETDESSDIY